MTKPTDNERREVAERLRILAMSREVDKDLFHDAIGVWQGGCLDGYDPVNIIELADLIEPEPERTCRMERSSSYFETEVTTWFCSECGSPIYNDTTPSYCLYCGAKVVDE